MIELDRQVIDSVRQQLAAEALEPTPESVAQLLRAEHQLVGSATVLKIVDELRTETYGAGVLDPLLTLRGVTDVVVNGPNQVYIDRGAGLEQQPVQFGDDGAVRRLAQRLAAQAGRRLDDSAPWVDAQLPSRTRLHAVLAPIARPGTTICLRIPAAEHFDLDRLHSAGAMNDDLLRVIRAIVDRRVAFVVSGGTGSGKTTVLAAMLSAVGPQERLVVVEDAAELKPQHNHVVGLESRPANVEGAGAVAMRELVRQALRMRPDRLVVGEVRGAEVIDLLAALNTGHEGGCGTIHANTATAVPTRFEALGVAAGLTREAVHSQLASSLEVVIHVHRDSSGRRFIREIATMQRGSDGLVAAVPALIWDTTTLRRADGYEALVSRLRRTP